MEAYGRRQYDLQSRPTAQDVALGPSALFYDILASHRTYRISVDHAWFIAQQDEPRTTAQLATTPSALDIAQANVVDFYDSSNRTLKYRVSQDGTQYVQYGGGGGGGGSSTYVGLSDSATANLPTVNTPLANALSTLATAISGKTGTLAGASDVGTYDLTTHNTPIANAIATLGNNIAAKPSNAYQAGAIPTPGIYSFNASTGLATDGTNSVALASSTVPTLSGKQFFCCIVSVGGTIALDTLTTCNQGDTLYLMQSGASQVWQRIAGVPLTGGLLKPDGKGGLTSAVPGLDYLLPALMKVGVPVGVAPSGTFTTNGSVTFGTPITNQSVSGLYQGIFLYYPANAITGSNAAGFYWTVPQSGGTNGTLAIVYNNVYTPTSSATMAVPVVPATPTAFSGVTGAAYTGVTTFVATHIVPFPAGLLGSQGDYNQFYVGRCTSNTNVKALKTFVGALGSTSTAVGMSQSQNTSVLNNSDSVTSSISFGNYVSAPPSTDVFHNGGVKNGGSIDFTQLQYLTFGIQNAVATDWQVIENYRVTANPKA